MTRAILSILTAAALLAVPAAAKDKPGQGKGHGKGQGKGQGRQPAAEFVSADRAFIGDYYRANPGQLPPGLAKRNGDLPPGLERQLRRNGTLPPGLEKRLVPFPPAIEARLAPCPPDVRRGIVGGMAVMFNSRSGLILDAFALIRR